MTRFVESTITFPYKRSLGPVVGAFMTALTEKQILGIRCGDTVLVPPMEWDPATGAELPHEFVEVGPAGTVESWTWVPAPSDQHPLDHPFAFALIRLDGATTPLLHAVDAGCARRHVRRDAGGPPLAGDQAGPYRRHHLLHPRRDTRDRGRGHRRSRRTGDPDGLPGLDHLSEPGARGGRPGHRGLHGAAAAGPALPDAADGCTPEGGATARSTPSSSGPSARWTCPTRAPSPTSPSSLPCQYPGQTETEPFVRAFVLLDGTDVIIPYAAVIELPAEQVRVGQRVDAVWASPAEETEEGGGMGGSWGSLLGLDPQRRTGSRRSRPREQDLLIMSAPSTDIAVIGWAQTPMVRHTDKSETQLLMEAITDAIDPLGLTRADIDFTCLGSCDYITGQAFSFVSNLDAIGAWPPKRDSHVEMDGAWALYEAWLRLQEGDIEIAVVTGSGRSSTGDPALIYPMEMDPYFLAPLGADPLTFAALQARAVIASGIADERSMAEVAVRSRGKGDVETLLAEEFVREPLRRHDVPPITDGAAAMVLATGGRARQLVDAARLHHRVRPPDRVPQPVVPGPGRFPVHPHRRRGRRPGRRAGGGGRAAGRLHPRGAAAAEGPRTWGTTWPSTLRAGPLRANPIMATGLCRVGYAADHIFGGGSRALAHSTSGPCLQQNLVCILEGRS